MRIQRAALPGWAWDMLAVEERRYGLPEVVVNWRIGRDGNFQSSGHADGLAHRIVITAGTDENDQRVMLLHELGHIIVGPRQEHGPAWRAVVDELWARYGVTEAAALHKQLVRLARNPDFLRQLERAATY